MNQRLVRLAMLSMMAALIPQQIQAANWHHSVTVPITAEYDSNPDMAPTNEQGIWRARVVPAYSLLGTFGQDEFKAGLALNMERSSDKNVSGDRQDPSLSLAWQRQTEAGGHGVTARFAEASTRVTELAESGLVTVDGTRTMKSLDGNWRAAINERNSISADATYQNVTYDVGAYTDYTNLSAGVTFSHALSERSEPFLRATASHYEPANATMPSSNNYSVLAGMKWKSSEKLDWTAQGGLARSTGQSDDTSLQASLNLHYQEQRSDFVLEVGRFVSPSGEGGYAEADQVRGVWGYAVDDRTHTGVEATWRDYKGVTASTTKQFGAWASRELTPFWNLRASYQHRQRQESGFQGASANHLGLTLVYTHPDL